MMTPTREHACRGGRDLRNPRPASIGTGGRLRSELPADFVGMRKPEPPGLTKMQEAWAEDFHPLVGIWDAVDACRRHLDIIRPTRPQNAARRLRAREIVKGVLLGWTFADVAVELCLDKGFLSRKVAEIYAEYPELERSLIFVNLLNNQAKRHKQSTPWGFQLQGGAEKSDGADGSTSNQLSPYNPAHVKLAELYHRAFPQPRSSYGTMVSKYFDDAPSRGTQCIEHVQRDRWGYEIGTQDYRAKIAGHKDDARQRNAVYQWRRLCQFAGLKDDEPVGPEHEWLLKLVAEDFFRAEARLRKANRFALELPASFYDAPWISSGYLDTPEIDAPVKFGAPYVQRINTCPKGKTWLTPRKPKGKWRKKLSERWAAQVHNHTKYGPDANAQFAAISPEPASSRISSHEWRKLQDRMHGSKWSRRPMCNADRQAPTNGNMVSVAPPSDDPLDLKYARAGCSVHDLIGGRHKRRFQFPLLPWEPEYAEYFSAPGVRPGKFVMPPKVEEKNQAEKMCLPNDYIDAVDLYLAGDISEAEMKSRMTTPPSTRPENGILFDRPVTAIANKQPMETNTNE